MGGRQKKILVVGSAPISQTLSVADLDGYYKIAINKSWRIRRDFDCHVYLKSLAKEDCPPSMSEIERVSVSDFTPVLKNAGGLYLTSGSVSMIAGYWSVARLGTHFLSYYGCDLVFPTGPDAPTHFYGQGDTGPLVGNFQYNMRQRERSIRLLCWSLLHDVLITNASGLEGTVLAFPKAPLHAEDLTLLDDVMSLKETQRLVRRAGSVFATEKKLLTPVFRQPQRVFEENSEALAAMNTILDEWADLEANVQDYVDRAEELIAIAVTQAGANRRESAATMLSRAQDKQEITLHLGFHKTASTSIQSILDERSPSLLKAGCQVVPHKKLRNNYTRVVEMFSNQERGIEYGEPLSAELFRHVTSEFFDSLKIGPLKRLVMSEENAAGHVGHCAFSGQLYPFASSFLKNFAANIPAEPLDVHVMVRDYASFFASSYMEYLGSTTKGRFIMPEVMMAKVMANMPSWCSILDILQHSFPQSQIHVWRFEDIRYTFLDFMSALTGVQASTMDWMDSGERVRRSSLGATEFEEFLSHVRVNGVSDGLDFWKGLGQTRKRVDRQAPNARFDPWTSAHKAHLAALYAQDIVRIAEDPSFTLHLVGGGAVPTAISEGDV